MLLQMGGGMGGRDRRGDHRIVRTKTTHQWDDGATNRVAISYVVIVVIVVVVNVVELYLAGRR